MLEFKHNEGWAITIATDHRTVSALVADVIAEQVAATPNIVWSLPTGSTPIPLFDILAARAAREEIDFRNVVFFSLDDYLGLHPSDPNSLSGWLQREFLNRVNVQPANVHLIPADDPIPGEAARHYDADLTRCGGFDLVVLGIGENGHIAFNEPGSEASTRTRVVEMTPETREQAAGYWNDQFRMPGQAMTIGMANILEARQIVLLVTGSVKATVLAEALTGDISHHVPASILRLAGARLHIFADASAASQLNLN